MLERTILEQARAEAYARKPARPLYLSELKELWKDDNARAGLQLLKEKRKLVIDDRYRLDANHKTVHWAMFEVR